MHSKFPSPVRHGPNATLMLRRRGGSGSGGTTITGSGSNIAGTGDPTGVVAAAEGSVYLDKTSGNVWMKFSGGSTSAGWVMTIQGG